MAMFRYVPVWARLCQSLAMTANNHLISVFFGGFLSVAAPSALDAVDAQQRQFDRLAAAAQDQERPVRESAHAQNFSDSSLITMQVCVRRHTCSMGNCSLHRITRMRP